MLYVHRKKYLQFKKEEQNKGEGVSIIYAEGFNNKKSSFSIINQKDKRRFKKLLRSLPNLNTFYSDLCKTLKGVNIFWLLSDLCFFHANLLVQTWMIEYIIGIMIMRNFGIYL